MATPREFAALFARTLDRFRDPEAKDEQKAQFRALAGLLKLEGMTIAVEDGRLVINGAVLNSGSSIEEYAMLQRLELHSVKEIRISPDPPVGEAFELLRAIAEQPGEEDIAARLKAREATRIAVTIQSFLVQTPVIPAASPAPVASAPLRPEPKVSHEAPGPDIPDIVRESTVDSAFSPALAILGRQLETAMKTHRIAQALTIVVGIVRAEQQVSDATRRRQYSIALKRMYSKALLEGVAELANSPLERDDALLVLRRAGEDGVEVLLDLLVAAPTIEERRGIFMALTGMKEGTDQLVHMLGHHQWFVVRNVAELAGELALEDAVPALAQQLDHDDERVRKAVALALAKIGSSGAAEPLRRALRDKSPEVRMQAALGVGGRKG